jgi:imidazolonepropionase-like amidohydrolase
LRVNVFIITLLTLAVCISGFARAAGQPSPGLTLISNVDIFDGKTEKLHKNMHAPIKDNLIETESKERSAIIQTDNVTMVDVGGRTLMPGMIEAHGHIVIASDFPPLLNQVAFEQGVHAARRAHDYLMAGFTTVGDCGGNSFGFKRALDAGASIGETAGHGDFRTHVDDHPYFDGPGIYKNTLK